MRRIAPLLLLLALCGSARADDPRVGIYAGPGTSPEDREALRRAIPALGLELRDVPLEELEGALAELDVLVVGGGSGTKLAKGLQAGGARAIDAFVKKGGGYVGVGAGAYLAARGYNKATQCLELVGARCVDHKNWKRGEGLIELAPLGEAKLPKQWRYKNGPLFAPARSHGAGGYVPLAKFVTDLQAADLKRAGIMPGRHAILRAAYGKGRVSLFSVLPHQRAETVGPLVDAVCWAAGDGDPVAATAVVPAPAGALKIAILDDAGCIDACVSSSVRCLDDVRRFWVRRVSGAQVAAGALDDYDVVVLPGGSATKQSNALGPEGRKRVKAFVRAGGGYVGVCAGAYLAVSEPTRYGLGLVAARAADTKNWKRGEGLVKVECEPALKKVTGKGTKELLMVYANGPLLEAMDVEGLPAVRPLAIFRSDMAKNGAPKGVMPGKLASLTSTFHQGRVVLFSTHPELTPTLGGMLSRAALWAGKQD